MGGAGKSCGSAAQRWNTDAGIPAERLRKVEEQMQASALLLYHVAERRNHDLPQTAHVLTLAFGRLR
jgi:hypothetical protein